MRNAKLQVKTLKQNKSGRERIWAPLSIAMVAQNLALYVIQGYGMHSNDANLEQSLIT